MKVVLTGGGSGGHINPALAIGQCIQAHCPDVEILYVGTPDGMEATLVPKAGYRFESVRVKGFKRNFKWASIKHNCRTLWYLLSAPRRAKQILRDFQPDVVIGTGGYVSGPVMLAATKLGIKTMLHEQNAFPGVTNKLLSPKVDVVLLAFEAAKERMKIGKKWLVVGNPVRASIGKKSKEQARRELGMDDDFCIFSVGGSLGAAMINQIAADLMEWNQGGSKCNHIHGYGGQGRKGFPKLLEERGVDLSTYSRVSATEYIDNMDTCFAAADLVITRCGAVTLSELELVGKAAILVPSPYVSENHQYYNGMVMVNQNAAVMVQEDQYNKEELLQLVQDLKDHPEKTERMGKLAYQLAVPDTTERIYQAMMELLS